MKCPNCGAELVFSNGKYFCKYCQSEYLKEEFASKETNNTSNVVQNNSGFIISGGVLLSYKGNDVRVVIPSNVISIGKGAFCNSLSLKEVIFNPNVRSIESNAFEGCVSLSTISGYENVVSFGDECFKNSGLTSVKIGQNVNVVGKLAFANCTKLKSVIFTPMKDLKLLDTFKGCSSLDDVQMDKLYFFPSLHTHFEVRNNPGNKRPTYGEVFRGTPFLTKVVDEIMKCYKEGICTECGTPLKKGLFHAKCPNCGIDYIN